MAVLQEIWSGPEGPLPKIMLPGPDSLLSVFAKELAGVAKTKGLYRRDNMVVLSEKGRLEIVTPQRFRTWVEEHLVCYKPKFDNAGDRYDVLQTMNAEVADGVLQCDDFRRELPRVRALNPVRAVLIADGVPARLLPIGYDADTKTLTGSKLDA
jgi:hypothetical protein